MSKFEESNFYKALQDFFINNDKETFLQFLAEFYNRTEGIIDKDNIQDDLIKELRELYIKFNEEGINENIVREKVNYFLENSVKINNILAKLDINTNKIEDIKTKLNTNTSNIENINSQLDNMGHYLTPEMFGAKGDGITDDTQAFKELILEAKRLNKCIRLSQNYYITEPLTIDFGVNIIGNGSDRNIIITDKNISVLNFSNDIAKSGVYLSNFGIKGSGLPQQIGLDLSYITNGSHIENMRIFNVGIAIKIRKTWYTSFNNIRISSCNVTGIDMCSIDANNQINNITFTSVNINQSEQCVTAENEQLSSGVNFM